jgi:hypothetical protein
MNNKLRFVAFLGAIVAGVLASLTCLAAAAEFLDKEPCTITVFAEHQPPVNTDCVVRSSMSFGAYTAIVTPARWAQVQDRKRWCGAG